MEQFPEVVYVRVIGKPHVPFNIKNNKIYKLTLQPNAVSISKKPYILTDEYGLHLVVYIPNPYFQILDEFEALVHQACESEHE